MEANWISVKDRLPNEGEKVLVAGTPIGITCAFYWGTQAKPNSPHNGWSILDVTHWMPLPEEPLTNH